MTVQRRGKSSSGGRRRQRQQRQRHRSQSTSDEGSSDGGSVTRCVCGEFHNVGLMVQCDKCEVWQHCECVGLEEKDIPEQYYCEECKPENHTLIKLSHGKTRRQYINASQKHLMAIDKKAPKKRMTLNSREASMSLEDVLATRNALVFAESYQKSTDATSPVSPKNSPNMQDEERTVKRPKHNEPEGDAVEAEDDKPQPSSSTVSSVGHEEPYMELVKEQDDNGSEEGDAAKPARQKRTTASRSNSKNETSPSVNSKPVRTPEKRGRGSNRRTTTGARRTPTNKPRSRTSTPQPAETESPSTPDISTSIFEHFSAEARATSPTARVRLPSARMTISEMNRRAKQILEYISTIQVEMANDVTHHQSPVHDASIASSTAMQVASPHQPNMDGCNGAVADKATSQSKAQGRPAPIIIPTQTDDGSPSSSLSSASTIPLNEDTPASPRTEFAEKGMAEEALEKRNTGSSKDKTEETSMEMMDMLTRELIKFQRRFGGRHHFPIHDGGSEQEGRVTRSRDASANGSSLRSISAS
ncbi:uncharacterized protein BYT42DRAFT_95181 [Radiomyces spectabilis]|uniref:uncharacterized protein n=1 Tax=Radiomyces spectabilis TaxID=64574 RepID=UPI002220900E|nr:uncharacterized protein BYT42DRAFT_95181 [Radiomyces spectabilis]KAI8370593.1 hypothetical protein BYT42DRAFT_95181 [Radiomyces spectabilis]